MSLDTRRLSARNRLASPPITLSRKSEEATLKIGMQLHPDRGTDNVLE